VLPVNDRIRLDEWRWYESRRQPITIYEIDPRRSGLPDNVTNSFYASDAVVKPFAARSGIEASVNEPGDFIYYEGAIPAAAQALECRLVVRSYPTWLAQSSLFARASQVTSASICRVDGKSPARAYTSP